MLILSMKTQEVVQIQLSIATCVKTSLMKKNIFMKHRKTQHTGSNKKCEDFGKGQCTRNETTAGIFIMIVQKNFQQHITQIVQKNFQEHKTQIVQKNFQEHRTQNFRIFVMLQQIHFPRTKCQGCCG